MASRFASRTTAEPCSTEVGNTMKSASARKSVRPSDSYTSSSSGSDKTPSAPTSASSSRRRTGLRPAASVAMARPEYTAAASGGARGEDGRDTLEIRHEALHLRAARGGVGRAQDRGGVDGGHHVRRPASRDPLAALPRHAELRTEQRL